MGPTKNTDTKRDTRSVEQWEEARRFKKPKQHQPDDDDPNNDDDYKEEQNSFEEEDGDNDDDDGAPPVVSHTQTSKGSTSCHVIECEDEEVGYEDHSKISKKLILFQVLVTCLLQSHCHRRKVKSVHMVHMNLQIVMKEDHTRNTI
jgi:hypothetical protein